MQPWSSHCVTLVAQPCNHPWPACLQATRALCEAAFGGQVLISHAVWERLRHAMHAAAFPVVQQLGCYKLAAAPEPLWVYQVRQHNPPRHGAPITNDSGTV